MQPVFIIGCQRSGTTLLGAMIGGHPNAISIPDSAFLIDLLPDRDGPHIDPGEVVDQIAAHPRFRRFRFPLGSDRPKRAAGRPGFRAGIEWYVAQYARSDGNTSPSLWVEHYPAHARRVPSLMKIFPDAKFIHLVRDGRGVAASLMALDWGPNDIIGAARFWLQTIAFGSVARNVVRPEDFCEVRYEDLVRSPEKVMRQLSGFIGIEFHPSMLGSENYWLPEYASDQQQLIGSPPVSGQADAWRKSLTEREIEIFEFETGDLLTCLGYPKLADPKSFRISFLERLAILIAGRARGVFRKHRYQRSMAAYER